MAQLLTDPIWEALDSNGRLIPNAQAFFYLTGTTTNAVVYSDNALTTPRTQPVLSDGAGRFPNTYLNPSVTYRLLYKDSVGATIRDIDPLNPSGTIGTADISDGAVTNAKLATNAVTTIKIADANVTNAKLANMAANTIKGRNTGTGAPVDLGLSDFAAAMGFTGQEATFTASTAPPGWLIRDGSLISRTTYANLWAWVQLYGVIAVDATDKTNNPGKWYIGDGSTTFTLPDDRGVFERFTTGTGSIDSGRAIGTKQADSVGSHTHPARWASSPGSANDHNAPGAMMTDDGASDTNTTTILANTGTTETRPINHGKLPCVRY